jgi:hypothetical protein
VKGGSVCRPAKPEVSHLATQESQVPYLPIAVPACRIEGSKPAEVLAIETGMRATKVSSRDVDLEPRCLTRPRNPLGATCPSMSEHLLM